MFNYRFMQKPKNELARENDNGTSSTASLIDDDENDLSRHSKRTVVEPVLFVLLTAVTLSGKCNHWSIIYFYSCDHEL